MAAPYWSSEDKAEARLRLGAVFALTLATTGISVGFSFLGRDFYNSLASKFLFFFSSIFGGVNLLRQFKLINIVLFVFFTFARQGPRTIHETTFVLSWSFCWRNSGELLYVFL